MAKWSWWVIIITAAINTLFAMSCGNNSANMKAHWLHGNEYQQFSSVLILWLVGLFFILSGRLRQAATVIIGYFLILSSTLVAIKLCWFS